MVRSAVREGDPVCGRFEGRVCAACEGRVTFAFVGGAADAFTWLDVWTASFRRFMRLLFAPSCAAVPSPEIEVFDDREGYIVYQCGLPECYCLSLAFDMEYTVVPGCSFSSFTDMLAKPASSVLVAISKRC